MSLRAGTPLPRRIRSTPEAASAPVRKRSATFKSEAVRAGVLSLLFLLLLLGIWHVATLPKEQAAGANDEYAKLMGKGAAKTQSKAAKQRTRAN